MAMFAKSRRSMEPFNEKVRERIFGFGSRMSDASSTSGSEHDADSDFASSSASSSSTCSTSPCLSYLVQNFIENAGGVGSSGGAGEPPSTNDASDSDDDYLVSDPTALIRDVINPIVRINDDRFRTDLIVHVSRAVEAFSLFRESQAVFNRNVMAYLRQIGYNAGVCKTKWSATPGGGLPAGSYEFIDVVRSTSPPPPEAFSQDPCSRYVIDLNFAGQFEIARGTECYRRLLDALPRVFVGKSDDLKRILRSMADETRRSMKVNGMTLPPWRKNRYVQAKWFGPYRRTVNQLPLSSATANEQLSAVKCRSVGFFTSAVEGGQLVAAPPTTRTR